MSNERQQRAARAEQMRKEREKADRKQRNFITVAIVAVVVALIAVGGYAIKSTSDANSEATKVVNPANTKNFAFDYDAVAAGGKAGANPVKVVLYEDFLCPVCKSFEAANGAFLDDAVKKGDITIEYRPVSILDSSATDDYSSRAASAAMCVLDTNGVGAYRKMHDLLFLAQPPETGPGLEDQALIDMATEAGATGIDSCVNTKKYGPWIKAATESARKDKISGTPTVRIDGKDVISAGGGIPQVADIQKAIAAAAAK